MRSSAVSEPLASSAAPPMLERDAELDVLRGALRTGGFGGGTASLVEGPAGIGKSRLLEAVATSAESRSLGVWRARGSRLENGFAFGVARRLLEPALGALDAGERARLLSVAATLFPRLTAGSGSGFVAASPEEGHEILDALLGAVAGLSEATPILMVIDDLHWADAPSIRFVALLVRRLDRLRVSLVLAARPQPEWTAPALYDDLVLDPAVRIIRPTGLSVTASAAVVERGVGRAVDPTFARACRDATGGNPFYLRELAQEIRERGIEPSEAHAGELHEMGPEAVTRSVGLRLAQLGPGAVAVARALAVLGDGAPVNRVARLAGSEIPVVLEAADRLRAAAVLAEGEPLAFEHPILRAAVLDALSAGVRASLHADAAALLTAAGAAPEEIAAHLLAAGPGMCPGADATLWEAGREALGRGAPDVTAAYLERALLEAPDEGMRASLRLDLGIAQGLRRDPSAVAHLSEAMTLARRPDDRLLAALALWSTYSFDGRVAEGLDVLRGALAGATGADPDLVLRAELELARGARSCVPSAEEGRERIGALRARLTGSRSTLERVALGLVAWDAMMANEPVDSVVATLERSLSVADIALERSLSQLAHAPLYTMIWCDRLDEAQRVLDALVDEAQRRGSAIGVSMARVWRTMRHLRAGDLGACAADGEAVLAAAGEQGYVFGQLIGQAWLAEVAVERGELDEAARRQAAIEAAWTRDVAQKGWMDHLRYHRGRWLLAANRPDEALDELLAVGRQHDRWLATCPSELAWRSDAALAAMATGDEALARSLANAELELARAFGAPRALGIALRVRGIVERDPASLREAVAVLERSPARLEHARALADLGALLHAQGEPALARPPLRAALDAAARCGATALAARARSALIATGARPRRAAATGVDALTAAELRVARLAAEGHGNHDIAEVLFLTRKTVESHLTSAYRKLGIATRGELAGSLARGLS